MLMASSWEHYSGNFGGVNLNCLSESTGTKLDSRFKELEDSDDAHHENVGFTIGYFFDAAFNKAST